MKNFKEIKSFDEWKKDIDHTVAIYDSIIQQKELELGAVKAIRDSYALASYPKMRYEAGMEDCGK